MYVRDMSTPGPSHLEGCAFSPYFTNSRLVHEQTMAITLQIGFVVVNCQVYQPKTDSPVDSEASPKR